MKNAINTLQVILNADALIYKLAMAGRQEKRDLLRIQKMFEKVYRETGKVSETTENGNAKFSASLDKYSQKTV